MRMANKLNKQQQKNKKERNLSLKWLSQGWAVHV